ncbi:MAG: amidophosphoribosyltransferase [Betaproteobacteria bacterium]|jgi:amidophosphoribosyltransferase
MCGIIGVVANDPVNQLIYDSLLLLQHRGQDAAGIATHNGSSFHMHKANGLVRDVFRTRNMRGLIGNSGIGQVRYPTAGSVSSEEEAQPFYVNAPFGMVLAHNGNLTNAAKLRDEMSYRDRRHINTSSDTEVLINVLADEIQRSTNSIALDAASAFEALEQVYERLEGSFAVVCVIAGHGLLAFRDSFGIRPLCIGRLDVGHGKTQWMITSESVAIEGNGFDFVRDVGPGEAIFIDLDGNFASRQIVADAQLTPCVFEYVYLARPDSYMDGISIFEVRMKMGDYLAQKILREVDVSDIDVVMPIPDSSRPAAMQVAKLLNLEYREGFFKNRYIGRTFIMPGQAVRKKSVRQKLNAMRLEFENKCVLIVDDSIVRGTTSYEIVQMARNAGARKVIFASAAPPVCFPNVYGIDMPTRSELVAYGRTITEINDLIGSDHLIYLDLSDLKQAIQDINPLIKNFEASCFDGDYVTGGINESYLDALEASRINPESMEDRAADIGDFSKSQLHLQLFNND